MLFARSTESLPACLSRPANGPGCISQCAPQGNRQRVSELLTCSSVSLSGSLRAEARPRPTPGHFHLVHRHHRPLGAHRGGAASVSPCCNCLWQVPMGTPCRKFLLQLPVVSPSRKCLSKIPVVSPCLQSFSSLGPQRAFIPATGRRRHKSPASTAAVKAGDFL